MNHLLYCSLCLIVIINQKESVIYPFSLSLFRILLVLWKGLNPLLHLCQLGWLYSEKYEIILREIYSIVLIKPRMPFFFFTTCAFHINLFNFLLNFFFFFKICYNILLFCKKKKKKEEEILKNCT